MPKRPLLLRTRGSQLKHAFLAIVFGLLCHAPRAQASETDPNSLSVSVVGEVQTLDWHRAGTAIEGGIIQNLMSGLYSIDDANHLVPALAESHQILEDGLVVRFKLKHPAEWSDGKRVTATHFVDGWKRLLDPKKKHRYAYLLFDIESARAYSQGRINDFSEVGVKALDESTLEVRLKGRRPHFLWNLTLWPTFPLRNDLLKKHGESEWLKPGKLVGNGPFILSEFRLHSSTSPGDDLVLMRRTNQGGAGSRVKRLKIHVGPLTQKTFAAFESGETDYIPFVYPGEMERPEHLSAQLVRMPSARIIHLNFNTFHGPSANRSFRRAVAQAIQKEGFQSLIEWGYRPLHTFSPYGWLGQSSKPTLAFDLVKARQELLMSGVSLNVSKPLELAVLQAPDTLSAARTLTQQLRKNLGLEIHLTEIPPSKVGAAIRATHKYDLWLFSVSAKHPEPEYFYSLFASDSGNNETGFQNSSYDTLLQLVRTDPNPERRARYYQDISRILVEEEVVAFPLFQDSRSALVAPNITGLDRSIFRPLDFSSVQRSPASRPSGPPSNLKERAQ